MNTMFVVKENKMGKMHIHYDPEGDYLEIRFGEPKASYYEHLGNDTFERRDKKTNKVFGYAFHNVRKIKGKSARDIEVDVPQILS